MFQVKRLLWLVGLPVVLLSPSARAELLQLNHDLLSNSAVLAQSIIQITDVQINTIDDELELNLVADGLLTEPTIYTAGNALIIELPNATLALEEDEFRQFEPAEDIALVQVSQLPNNEVRVTVTGIDAPPTVATTIQTNGLTLSLVPGTAPASDGDEELRILVIDAQESSYNPSRSSVATDTDTPLRNVPFSVQVIPRAVIDDRNVTELGEALATAGSVTDSGGRGRSEFGPNFLIRGFPVGDGVFRDGIPTFSLSALSTNDV